MGKIVEDTIEGLKSAGSFAELQESIVEMRDAFDIDHVVYHSVTRSGEQYAALTYTPEWVTRYVECDYARIDPVVQSCYQRFHPVDWSELDWSRPNVREFRGEAAQAGVGNQGLSMPLRGPNGQFALFTVSRQSDAARWQSYCNTFLNDFVLLAHFVNHKALELDSDAGAAEKVTLSPREIDTLTLLAMGYSRAQAAEALSISEHTLRVYIETSRRKLRGMNTTHAVAKAIACGAINP